MNKVPTLAQTEAWIASAEMDRASEYAARGRHHSGLPMPVLIERWKEALAEFARELGNMEKSAAESDLKCEIRLRGIEPPFAEVQASLDLISRTFEERVATMSREDRSELERLEQGVVAMVDQFSARPIERDN